MWEIASKLPSSNLGIVSLLVAPGSNSNTKLVAFLRMSGSLLSAEG